MVTDRVLLSWLAGVPAGALIGSYLWLALDHGTPWLLGTVVHEGGRYTLAQTILYWRHFLRELPVVALYAAASVAAATVYGPRCTSAPSRAVRILALAAAVALVAGAWMAAAREWGADVARREVLQSYLRDDDAPVAGIHWGYHLLSTLAYVAAAVVLGVLVQRLLDGRARTPRRAARMVWLGGVGVATVVLTILCGGLPLDTLADPRHLGHQAREAATHLVVTLPLAFAVLLAVGRWQPDRSPSRASSADLAIALASGALLLAYLAIGAIVTGAARAARPDARLSALIAAHDFEHTLDYLLVALLVVGLAPGVHPREGDASP
ncbi:MAG TPA: hypothetical protein VMS22_13820 [Candidatus Eisenbacteria bacterium]|nr:hypothetical protein [Candidatus Eisenbacteria bacterium]